MLVCMFIDCFLKILRSLPLCVPFFLFFFCAHWCWPSPHSTLCALFGCNKMFSLWRLKCKRGIISYKWNIFTAISAINIFYNLLTRHIKCLHIFVILLITDRYFLDSNWNITVIKFYIVLHKLFSKLQI